MFSSLYNVYSKLKRPSSMYWLNMWSYSNMNSWCFLSQELLTFYIESVRGFKSVTISTFQIFPQILYPLITLSFILVQISLILG